MPCIRAFLPVNGRPRRSVGPGGWWRHGWILTLLLATSSPAIVADDEVALCAVELEGRRIEGPCDARFWRYRLIDPGGAPPATAAQADGAPGRPFPEAGALLPRARRYVQQRLDPCRVTGVEDGGWLAAGGSLPVLPGTAVSPRFAGGVEVANARELVFHYACPDGREGRYRLIGERERRFVGTVAADAFYLELPALAPGDTQARSR